MSEAFTDNDISPEVIFEISTAEAGRLVSNTQLRFGFMAELSGDDLKLYPEQNERTYERRVVDNLARFSGVMSKIDGREAVQQLFGSDEELADNLKGDRTVVHAAALKSSLAKSFDDMAAAESDADYLALSKRELTAVLELSQSNDVPLPKVYEDDGLYNELQRRIFTPLEMASLYMKGLKNLKVETRAAIFADFYQASRPNLDIDREMMLSVLKSDPNLLMTVRVERDACRQMFMYEALQIWGQEGLDQLPDDIRERLRPRLKIVSALAKLMESQNPNE